MSDEFNLVNDLAESRAQVYGAYADFFSGNGSSGFAGNWSELVRYQTGVEALLEMTSGRARGAARAHRHGQAVCEAFSGRWRKNRAALRLGLHGRAPHDVRGRLPSHA